jgi:hypothetical protein
VRLVERDYLGLSCGANQLLPRERRIADQRLQRCLGACPEIDDVRSEIFGCAGCLEMRENRTNPVQSAERRL